MAASAALVLCALGGALGLARSPQLVSFAPPAAVSVPEPSLAFNALPPINPQPAQARPQLVKAVLPPRPHKASAHLFPATRNMEDRVVDQLPVEPQQQWIVLTEWHTEEAPPPVVFTVVHRVRPSYAAVPFEDGWLIVQI